MGVLQWISRALLAASSMTLKEEEHKQEILDEELQSERHTL